MSRAAIWLLSAGVLLFAAVLLSQGVSAVVASLAVAGSGLLWLALLHLVPVILDAASISVLFRGGAPRASAGETIIARWLGESANSFLPAGPIGGPVVMSRFLARSGIATPQAAAAVTVSTTMQTLAQVIFALLGLALLGMLASHSSQSAVLTPLLIAGAVLACCLAGFYFMQRRGLFAQLMRLTARLAGKRDWSELMTQAAAIDAAVLQAYGRRSAVGMSFVLSLMAWLIGTAEVYLILYLLHTPVDWAHALLLESLGQAIRAAGFAIPGSLGVQEGGYLLLAPLAALAPETALALSLAKRAREVLLGVPGLLYLQHSERAGRREAAVSSMLDS
ncbi:MAG: flippase-like domain-containing protein [Sinobacteraceae bacterium]|nr:flippase-like domain-containing protein [Nevskiaceae bacterium]